jgi:hypothetical protein
LCLKNALRPAYAAKVDHVQQAAPSDRRPANIVIQIVVETASSDLLHHGCAMKAECGELCGPIL